MTATTSAPDLAPPPLVPSAPSAGIRSHVAVEVLRVALGLTFLWPFFDKLFGLGYSTSGKAAWIAGGSPTKGFLSHVEVGPLQSTFRSMAGNPVINTLFMLALLGVGAALLLGVLTRVAAGAGVLLLVLMWAAEWPLARHTSAGDPTGSTNPFLDYHLVYAIGLLVVATLGSASWGLARWWSRKPVVAAHPVLR